MENEVKLVEPNKMKLDEVDQLKAKAAYLDMVAANNALVALQSQIQQRLAEAQLLENQKTGFEKVTIPEKKKALQGIVDELKAQYSVPDGWNVDIESGVIAPAQKK